MKAIEYAYIANIIFNLKTIFMQSFQPGDDEPVNPEPSVPEAVPAPVPEVPATDDDVVTTEGEDGDDGRDVVHVPDPKKGK